METFTIPTLMFKVEAHLHRSTATECRGTIFYLHGGGFVFGHCGDLPKAMISQFNDHGFHVFAVDYPLAPEATLTLILKSVMMTYTWWSSHRESVCGIPQKDIYFFGRSAGAYLAQFITHQLNTFHRIGPKGLILFYGYSHFDQSDFTSPSSEYLRYPRLLEQEVQFLRTATIQTRAQATARLPLYLHARQHGSWLTLLGIATESMPRLDLRSAIPTFPATFLAASPLDPDVPFNNSLSYAQVHPRCTLYRAEGTHHDFDQVDRAQCKQVLTKLILWLTSLSHGE